MGKLLTWVIVAGLVWLAWRLVVISSRRTQRSAGTGANAGKGAEKADDGTADRLSAPERMLQCAVCGVHLPASEGRFAAGKVYCSDAHRDMGQASPDASDPAHPPRSGDQGEKR